MNYVLYAYIQDAVSLSQRIYLSGSPIARTRHADLQLPAMCIYSTLKEIEGITKYFEKYRNEGSTSSLSIAKVIANEMDVDPLFPIKRRVTSNEKIVRYIPYNSAL